MSAKVIQVGSETIEVTVGGAPGPPGPDTMDMLATLGADDGAEQIGTKATGRGAASRTAAQVMDEFVFAAGSDGYVEEGEATETDSYAAIMAPS